MKIRHGPVKHRAKVRVKDPEGQAGGGGGVLSVTLPVDESVAPGQYCALYDGDICLGAGPISEESYKDFLASVIPRARSSSSSSSSSSDRRIVR